MQLKRKRSQEESRPHCKRMKLESDDEMMVMLSSSSSLSPSSRPLPSLSFLSAMRRKFHASEHAMDEAPPLFSCSPPEMSSSPPPLLPNSSTTESLPQNSPYKTSSLPESPVSPL
eukprot:TRINITY_DN4569_c0_g1_i1.p1 TRINITY_DN4569_c0_g1~~TRINITY_DN4569_c0_g1_i1.p1  ORF type:complete len:115 (+),score=15.53 TRINITY_DN4569_c0_g1_i1:61-405(+)